MKKLFSRLSVLWTDELLRHTVILFAGMLAVHICNLMYQMAVSRALPADEYALLTAFLGVLAIISYPLSTLTTGLSHYSSLLRQEGRTGDVKRLLYKWTLIAGAPALLLGVGVIVFHAAMADFLHLNRAEPVIIAGVVLPAMFWLPVLTGTSQGLQLFGWSSGASIAGAALKLMLGAVLVWFWVPACGWALLGHGAGAYVSLLVFAAGLFLVLRKEKKTGISLPSIHGYLLQSFAVLAGFAVLMNADVVLVKHYLPAETEFAKAATLGRVVAFLPAAVAMAMFPKVASSGGTTSGHRLIFVRSFGYTVLCVLAAAVVCLLIPRILLQILFGTQNAEASTLLMTRMMAVTMSVSALLNVIVQFLLAQRRFTAALSTVAAGALYLLSAYFFHRTVWQIIAEAAVFNVLALLPGLYAVLRK